MKTIFDACQPRAEVLDGELKEQQFAASLTRVLRGTADQVYGDAPCFFANTYATSGLKALLVEALGRLSGKRPDGASVIRLETSFGGGKTHNLIGLYHLARRGVEGSTIKDFVKSDLIPSASVEKIAGVVGPDMDVSEQAFERLKRHKVPFAGALRLVGSRLPKLRSENSFYLHMRAPKRDVRSRRFEAIRRRMTDRLKQLVQAKKVEQAIESNDPAEFTMEIMGMSSMNLQSKE